MKSITTGIEQSLSPFGFVCAFRNARKKINSLRNGFCYTRIDQTFQLARYDFLIIRVWEYICFFPAIIWQTTGL